MKADELFDKVTADLVAQIEAGAGTWEMPWKQLASTGAPLRMNGEPYKGINWWILGLEQLANGYRSNRWGTYNAWMDQGEVTWGTGRNGKPRRISSTVHVRKGEEASHAILWKQAEPSKARKALDPDAKPYLLATAFPIFNRDQVDGLPELPEAPALAEHERWEQADAYFRAVGAAVREDGDRAYYAPVQDYIAVPTMAQFPNRDHFYTTMAHEHVHWTGHESRLKRDIRNRFGDEAYAAEELIAEIGAAFWGAQMGLEPAVRKDHSAYLGHWLKILKGDSRAISTAASQASKAVEYLNNAAGFVLRPDMEMEVA
jgi:antirestriction protein ArdC